MVTWHPFFNFSDPQSLQDKVQILPQGYSGFSMSISSLFQSSSVQSLSHVWLFVTPWTTTRQSSLSITSSWSLLKLMSIKLVMPSNHLILCRPLLLLPSIFPSIRVFSCESVLHIRWPKYWSLSFNISPSNEYSGLTSFRIDWLYLLEVQGTLKSLHQHQNSKASILRHSVFFIVQLSHPYMTTGKTIALARWTFVGKVTSLLFNRLSRLVITSLPRSNFNFMAAVTVCRDFIHHSPDPPLHGTPSGLCVLSAWNSLSLSNWETSPAFRGSALWTFHSPFLWKLDALLRVPYHCAALYTCPYPTLNCEPSQGQGPCLLPEQPKHLVLGLVQTWIPISWEPALAAHSQAVQWLWEGENISILEGASALHPIARSYPPCCLPHPIAQYRAWP